MVCDVYNLAIFYIIRRDVNKTGWPFHVRAQDQSVMAWLLLVIKTNLVGERGTKLCWRKFENRSRSEIGGGNLVGERAKERRKR